MDGLSFDPTNIRQGEWHGGLPAQIRLHIWFQEANLCAYLEDSHGRKRAIDNIYREIKPKLTKEELDDCNASRLVVRLELKYIQAPLQRRKRVVTPIEDLIDVYEDKVRYYADKHGLTNPDKQDPSQAIFR